MSIEFLDPTHESTASEFALAKRLTTLQGATVAIISNGKKSTEPFFDAVEHEFVAHFGVGKVVRIRKSNYSAPVEPELLKDAENWQALVAGVGD